MMTVEVENSSQDDHKSEISLKNRYWAKTNFGLSISYEFIKRYFLRDIICKRSLKLYKSVEIYHKERNNCMLPILREFVDREVYKLAKSIENPHFAVTLTFNDNDNELVIVGPLCKSKVQAKIEASMTLFKILYHFNCKLLPFVEGNINILNKFMTINNNNSKSTSENTSVNSKNGNNETSVDFPSVFSRNGWEDVNPEYNCFENLCHPNNLFFVSIVDFIDDPMMNFVDPITGEKKRMYIGYLTKKPMPHIEKEFYCYNGTKKSKFSLTPWDKFSVNHSQEEINELTNYLQSIFGYKTIVKKNSDIRNKMNKENYIIDNSDCQGFLPVHFNSNEYSKIKRFQDKLWGLLCISLEFKMNEETDDMYYILPFYKSYEQEDSKLNVDWYFINYILQEKANPDDLTVADWMATVDFLLRNDQKDVVSPSKGFEKNYNTVKEIFKKLKEDPSFIEEYKSISISQENKKYIMDTLRGSYFRTSYNRRVYLLSDIHESLTMFDEFTVNHHREDEAYQSTYKNYLIDNYPEKMKDYKFQYIQFSLISGKVFSLLKNFDYHSERELELIRLQKENKAKKSSSYQAWFIPELCNIFLLPIYWLKFLQYIPILTYKLKTFCFMGEFRYDIGIKPLSVINLAYAATSKNSDIISGNRHEQLEILGDTILKYLSSIFYYNRYPEKNEAFLTSIRMKYVSNENLILLTNHFNWNRFFLQKKFSISYFHPPNIGIIDGMRVRENLCDIHDNKPMADFFESIIGACFIEGKSLPEGLQICQLFLRRSGLITPIECNRKPINDVTKKVPGYDYDEVVKKICKVLNHTYSKTSNLYTVLYLLSLSTPVIRREFQRLEYLGDAVIDLIAINYFCNRYKGANPKEITQFKHLSVQNQSFANIINDFGLIDCLPFPASTKKEIENYREMKKNHSDYPYPKNIADLFEVFVGAVHIDNNYQFEKTNEELLDLLSNQIFHSSEQNKSIEKFEVINGIIEILSDIGRDFSRYDGFLKNPKSVYQTVKISNSETSCNIQVLYKEQELITLTEFKCTGFNKKLAKRKVAQKVMDIYNQLGREAFKEKLYNRISLDKDTVVTLDFWTS